MTWTSDITTDIGLIRMEMGDDTLGTGVLPDGSNLSDEQLQIYLDREGTVMRAVAGICEMLATRWSAMADLQVGPRRESLSQVSAMYARRAESLRERYGEPDDASGATAWSVGWAREDGYADAYTTAEYSL